MGLPRPPLAFQAGADVDATDQEGRTAFVVAVLSGNESVLRLLQRIAR
jgi:hypothetical protein